MLKAVLFDLDGTLLPMDQRVFVRAYFGRLAKKLAPHGYDPDDLIKTIWMCTDKMIANDGGDNNDKIFWKAFGEHFGEKALDDMPIFDDYYVNEFEQVKDSCGFSEHSAQIVKMLKDRGVRVILATNPIFPRAGTYARMRWAGLDPNDFELVTTYENIGYCKPNTEYYKKILSLRGLDPADCVMVGNDVDEDIVPTLETGMRAFLLTDCLINKNNVDTSTVPQGGFDALQEYLREQMN